MTERALPPGALARLDQDLADADRDFGMILRIYLHRSAAEGETQAMIDVACVLRTAPSEALIGMLIAALHRAHTREK